MQSTSDSQRLPTTWSVTLLGTQQTDRTRRWDLERGFQQTVSYWKICPRMKATRRLSLLFTVAWTNSGKNFRIDVIHSSLSSHSACSVSFPHYLYQDWTWRGGGEEVVGGDCLVIQSGKWTSRDSSTEDEPKRIVWPILPRKSTKTHTRLRWMAYCLLFVGL